MTGFSSLAEYTAQVGYRGWAESTPIESDEIEAIAIIDGRSKVTVGFERLDTDLSLRTVCEEGKRVREILLFLEDAELSEHGEVVLLIQLFGDFPVFHSEER